MTGPPPPTWAVDPDAAGVREIVDGVWRLRLPLPWPGIDHVNAYAIARDDGGLLLVDCGTGGDTTAAAALRRALGEIGFGLEDVRALALTHAHSDHCGQAATIVAASGAELWMHPAAGHFYDAWTRPDAVLAERLAYLVREGVPEARRAALAGLQEEHEGADGLVAADRALVEGATLPSALGDWTVLETPGHAPSHIGLHQPEHGLLIAGDLVCIAFTPWFDVGYTPDPLGETLASLARLDALARAGAVTRALPGHGRPLDDLPAIVALHRDGLADLAEHVRARLSDAAEPLDAWTLTAALHDTADDLAATGHLVEVLAALRHLERVGSVSRAWPADGGASRYRAVGGAPAAAPQLAAS